MFACMRELGYRALTPEHAILMYVSLGKKMLISRSWCLMFHGMVFSCSYCLISIAIAILQVSPIAVLDSLVKSDRGDFNPCYQFDLQVLDTDSNGRSSGDPGFHPKQTALHLIQEKQTKVCESAHAMLIYTYKGECVCVCVCLCLWCVCVCVCVCVCLWCVCVCVCV